METRRTSSTVYIVKQLSKETTQLRHNNEGLSYRSLHTGDTFHFKLQDLLFLFYFTVGEFLSCFTSNIFVPNETSDTDHDHESLLQRSTQISALHGLVHPRVGTFLSGGEGFRGKFFHILIE